MSNGLEVDATGLRAASARSSATAAALVGATVGGICTSHPGGAGVAAVNAALASMLGRQCQRMTAQADDVSVSGARYDTSDSGGSNAITTVSV